MRRDDQAADAVGDEGRATRYLGRRRGLAVCGTEVVKPIAHLDRDAVQVALPVGILSRLDAVAEVFGDLATNVPAATAETAVALIATATTPMHTLSLDLREP